MKRISIIIASALAAMLSASCSKSIETPAAPSPGESIILDLNIAGFDGAGDTKAVKKGWAAGDKLNLWFDDWNYTAQANNPTPDLVITYDGSKWTADALAAGRSLKPSGKFSVVYEGFNNLSGYMSSFYSGSQWFRPHKEYMDGTVYCNHLCYYRTEVNYTYAGSKLTAAITDWRARTSFKVLVKGLNPLESEDYILQTADITTPGSVTYLQCPGPILVMVSPSCPDIHIGSSNYKGYQGGVPDADGVAFYYVGANFTSATVEFRLFKKNATSGNFDEAAKAPKFTGKTLVTDGKSIKGIVIDKSKFE